MQITWFGHSAFRLGFKGKAVLIDPFFTGNPKAPKGADQIKPDYILLSHGHGDHLGDSHQPASNAGTC